MPAIAMIARVASILITVFDHKTRSEFRGCQSGAGASLRSTDWLAYARESARSATDDHASIPNRL
jgi:hypothetical protein